MFATVRIPAALRKFVGGVDAVEVSGTTVGEVFDSLRRDFPDLHSGVCDDAGEVRKYVNVFLGGEDIRFLAGMQTPVGPEADRREICILAAIAGG